MAGAYGLHEGHYRIGGMRRHQARGNQISACAATFASSSERTVPSNCCSYTAVKIWQPNQKFEIDSLRRSRRFIYWSAAGSARWPLKS